MNIKIGITGHCKLADSEQVRNNLKECISRILIKHRTKKFTALTSLATGADTVFAEVAMQDFKADIQAVFPFSIKEYEKDFEERDRIIFHDWLKKSKHDPLIIKSANPKTHEDRNQDYLRCGKYIANNCDVLIAVWDGQIASGIGGTGDIVEFAWLNDRKMILISTNKQEDKEKKEAQILYENADKLADRLRNRYNHLWLSAIVLSVLGALILSISISFGVEEPYLFWFSLAEMFCILFALGLGTFISTKRLKQNRILERRDAERLRILGTFIEAGIPVIPLKSNAQLNLKNKNEVVVLEDNHNLKNKSIVNERLAKLKVGLLVENQIDYHERNVLRLAANLLIAEKILRWIKWIFIAGLILHTLVEYLLWRHIGFEEFVNHFNHITMLLCLGLPPLFAAIEGYKYFKEWEHFSHDSQRMIALLRNKNEELKQTLDKDRLKCLANEIRQDLFNENDVWASILINKDTPGP